MSEQEYNQEVELEQQALTTESDYYRSLGEVLSSSDDRSIKSPIQIDYMKPSSCDCGYNSYYENVSDNNSIT